jgi:hypothetical protein
MTETFHDENSTWFGFLNFGHCDLFVFWNLLFRISVSR